jgi:hypothetical protein
MLAIALSGLAVISVYKLAFTGFKYGVGLFDPYRPRTPLHGADPAPNGTPSTTGPA